MDNFYIIANSDKDRNFELTGKICDYLTSRGKKNTYQKYDENCYNYADADKVPEGTECVIVLGGDGTLIQAARDLSGLNIPVFGVNIGTLGYLTEIEGEHVLDAIDLLIEDKFYLDERMILHGSVYRGDKLIYSDFALNDIVINRVGPLQVINFDIYVNDEFLISYPADGLIVSTPTGSTAYNLSAGGPIVNPQTDIVVVTPVCPHVLNKSSIIFDGTDELQVRMTDSRNGKEERVVTFDGSNYINLISGDRIIIHKSDKTAKFIRSKKHNFLEILRNKLS